MPPAINPYWQQAAWFIDPQNASGNASDGNTGADSAHPLVTYAELAARWGTYSPQLRQSTTITFLSSHTDDTDPVIFLPIVMNGAVIVMQGTLGATQQIAAGVLSNVTAKNRAAPQLLLAQSGATAAGQLVVNTTHASRAFTYAVSAGAIFKMCQPLAPVVVPSVPNPAEVDTWANGDAVTVYAPVQVNLVRVGATFDGFDAGLNNSWIWLYQLNIWGTGAFDACTMDSLSVQCIDVVTRRTVLLNPMISGSPVRNPRHCNLVAQRLNGGHPAALNNFQGGALLGGLGALVNAVFDADCILGTSANVGSGGGIFAGAGAVYVDTGFNLQPALGDFNISNVAISGLKFVWGPGGINIVSKARVVYPPGAGQAAAIFLQTGGFLFNGSAGCVLAANNAAPTAGKTLSAANLDADLGATVAAYYVPGGPSITNEAA